MLDGRQGDSDTDLATGLRSLLSGWMCMRGEFSRLCIDVLKYL